MPRGTPINSNKRPDTFRGNNPDLKVVEGALDVIDLSNEDENSLPIKLSRQTWMLDACDSLGFCGAAQSSVSYSESQRYRNTNAGVHGSSLRGQASLREENIKLGISSRDLTKSAMDFKKKVDGGNGLWGSRKSRKTTKTEECFHGIARPVSSLNWEKKDDRMDQKLARLYSDSKSERSLAGKFTKGCL